MPAIIRFAIPMMLGNLFQQLYNTVDAAIVGRVLGKDALAAVGVANPIMSIAIFLIFGLCIGLSTLLAQLYGAHRDGDFKREISTSLLAGLGFTVVVGALFFFLSRPILVLTRTPAEILDSADGYLRVIFCGLIFSFLYNFYSSSLRAMGDSRTPFLFLLVSSVLNVGLDILFVAYLGTGVEGAAWATVISQGISSLLCIVYVYRSIPLLALSRKELIFDPSVLRETLAYGWAAAVQQTFLYVGRLLVQGVVNPLGTSTIAAFNAAMRVEAFVFAPFDSIGTAASTFCAQNKGADQPARIRQGFNTGRNINLCCGVLSCVLLLLFASPIMTIFVDAAETEVIRIGAKYLIMMAPLYIMTSYTYNLQGFFRAVGLLWITMIATGGQIFLRVVLAYWMVPFMGIAGVCVSIAIGWVYMIIFEQLCLRRYFGIHSL